MGKKTSSLLEVSSREREELNLLSVLQHGKEDYYRKKKGIPEKGIIEEGR